MLINIIISRETLINSFCSIFCMAVRFESHLHTEFSDGGSYKKMINSCVKKKIDVVAVTDHDTMRGIPEITDYARKRGVIIIPSEEVETTQGEILAYNLKKEIPRRLSPLEAIRRIHKQGGLAFAAHPFHLMYWWGLRDKVLGLKSLDGIEVVNYFLPNFLNNKARALLLARPELCFLGGSDAHHTSEVGLVINKVEARKNIDSVLKAVMNKKVKIIVKKHNFLIKYLRFAVLYSTYYPREFKRMLRKK